MTQQAPDPLRLHDLRRPERRSLEGQSDERTERTKDGTTAKMKTSELRASRRSQMAAAPQAGGMSYSLILIDSRASTPKDWAQ